MQVVIALIAIGTILLSAFTRLNGVESFAVSFFSAFILHEIWEHFTDTQYEE